MESAQRELLVVLLEMSMAKAITISEFKKRNDGFNEQMKMLESRLAALREQEQKSKTTAVQLDKIKAALKEELSFQSGINAELATSILDHITVKKGSTSKEIHLDIHLKFGEPYEVALAREKSSLCDIRFLTERAKGETLWKASGQACFRDYNREMVCHWRVGL